MDLAAGMLKRRMVRIRLYIADTQEYSLLHPNAQITQRSPSRRVHNTKGIPVAPQPPNFTYLISL